MASNSVINTESSDISKTRHVINQLLIDLKKQEVLPDI